MVLLTYTLWPRLTTTASQMPRSENDSKIRLNMFQPFFEQDMVHIGNIWQYLVMVCHGDVNITWSRWEFFSKGTIRMLRRQALLGPGPGVVCCHSLPRHHVMIIKTDLSLYMFIYCNHKSYVISFIYCILLLNLSSIFGKGIGFSIIFQDQSLTARCWPWCGALVFHSLG